MEFTSAVRGALRRFLVRNSQLSASRFKSGTAGLMFALTLAAAFAATDAGATPAVGVLAGSAGVGQTGAATYSIPISLPPGTHGMQPALSLVYSSQSGDGWAGYGWTIAGMSSISRCTATKEDDGVTATIQLAVSDDYCLDGQKLRFMSGTYGGSAIYGTEIEGFSQIISYTDGGATGGPSWFQVKTKDGRVFEYGNTTDSKILAQGTTVARAWALDKVTDAAGNYMTYQYQQDTADGDYWPLFINYTGNTNAGAAPDHQVEFDWTPRPAGTVLAQYLHGSIVAETQRLSTIKVNYAGSATFTYSLSYQQDAANGRSQLIQVQECGADGSCLPATTITWQSAQAGWAGDLPTNASVTTLAAAQEAHLMDVDGDGIQDLVYPGATNWMVMFGQPGGGFGNPVDSGVSSDPTYYGDGAALEIDYYGNGRHDLAVPLPGGGYTVLIPTGSRSGQIFTTPPNNLPNLPVSLTEAGSVSGADFHGIGASDIVTSDGTYTYIYANNGGTFGAQQLLYTVSNSAPSGQNFLTRTTSASYSSAPFNFDGSGRSGALELDTVAYSSPCYQDYSSQCNHGQNPTVYYWNALLSNEAPGYTAMGSLKGASLPPIPVDVNGDGLTDLLYTASSSNSYYWQLGISTGTGFTVLTTTDSNLGALNWANTDPIIADYYSDGRQDAIVQTGTGHWALLNVTYTPGSGFAIASTVLTNVLNSNYVGGTLRVGNIEANGLSDLVYAVPNGSGYSWRYALHNGGVDLVTKVTDGLGNYCQFQYASLAAGAPVYAKGNSAVYPVQDMQPAMQVVQTYTGSDGMGQSYNINYAYSGAEQDVQGRGFLGFAGRSITDTRSGNIETLSYSQSFPFIGMLTKDVLNKGNGSPIRETDNTGADQISPATGNSSRTFPFFDSSVTTDYDTVNGTVQPVRVTSTTVSQSSFDAYGNLLNSSTKVTDATQPGNPAYQTATSYAYAAPGSGYCVSLPASMTVQRTVPASSLGASFNNPASRSVTYVSDTAHCRSSQQTISGQSGDGSSPLTTAYSYDPSYGNVTETDVSGSGISTHTQKASYAAQNNEFPVSSTAVVSGTLSLTSSAAWRYDMGLQTGATDPNGNVTSEQYDAYGRPVKVTRPDGSASTWSYQWCNASPTFACPVDTSVKPVYEVVTGQINSGASSSITTGYTVYDSLGRALEQGQVLLGGVLSKVDTNYNQMGEVTRVTKPSLSGAYPALTSASLSTYYLYDLAMGRATEIDAPQDGGNACNTGSPSTCNNTTTFAYSGFTTQVTHQVTNSASSNPKQITYQTSDALGEVLSTTDANGGITQYNYDAFGDLIATQDANSPNSHKTFITFDGLGHKTGMTDPNMGTWTYVNDALGELICQTDAKNQSIIMGYDGVGRLISKLETAAGAGCTATAGTMNTWSYDTQSKGLGLPASVSDSNGFQRSYGYDGLSRLSDVTTTIGGTPYDVSTSYDSFGRVQTVTYPVSVTPAAGGSAPTAVASAPPGIVNVGSQVTLDGSGSTDPNGLALQYQWTETAGPTLNIGNFDAAAQRPYFTPSASGTYTFQLEVIDSHSAISAPASVSVTVGRMPPAAPGITPNPSTNGSVTLSWTSVANVTSYNVYQSTDNVTFTLIQNVADSGTGSNTATVTGLATGTYYFALGSKSNGVNGNMGASASEVVLLPPTAPAGMGISPATSYNGSFTLSWTAPANTTQYRVFQSTNGGNYVWVDTFNNSNPGAISRPEGGLSQANYTYVVQACNASGCSPSSAAVSGSVIQVPAMPSAGASPSTIAPGGTSTLVWSPNSSPVTYYQVYGLTGLIYSGTATSTDVSSKFTRNYKVYACNGAGCSSPNTVTVTVSTGGCRTCAPVKPASPTSSPGSSTAPAPATSSPPVGALVPRAGSLPTLPEEQAAPTQIVSAVASLASVHATVEQGTPAILATLGKTRRDLTASQPPQPAENTLQARFNRLSGTSAQTLALASPSAPNIPQAGTPKFAPPVYQAYAGLRHETVTGSPYRFAVQYNYDPASGALAAVADANTGFIYWRAATSTGTAPVDAFGHIVGYIDGNNVSTVSTFDAATGAVTGISTGIGGSTAVQQLAYTWDGLGNLKQRCDANRGLVENFTYDGLNRLATSQVYSGGTAGSCAQGPTAGAAIGMHYDNIGNITSRTNTGITVGSGTQNDSYTYGDPNHPYAVTGVTSIAGTYAYDANGNMTSGNGRTISWNDDNLPTYIASTGTVNGNNTVTGSSTFSYGPDLQRYQQTTTDSIAGNSTTTYVGGLFEVYSISGTTQYRHNIMAGGQVIAVHTLDQSGNATTNYMHSDHLGSSDTITSDAGAITQQTSFDAFGLRRDAATWAYDLTGAQIALLKGKTDRGFTNQEQLDNVGLVHMNGRVYDPGLGRMISTDPTIPNSLNSQAYNRYAYIYNNPLNATDPSGFDPCKTSTTTKTDGSGKSGCYNGKNGYHPGQNTYTGSNAGFDDGVTCSGNCGFASNDPAVIAAKNAPVSSDAAVCSGCCALVCGPIVMTNSDKFVVLGVTNQPSSSSIDSGSCLDCDLLAFSATYIGAANIGTGATTEVLNIGVESFLADPLAQSASEFDTTLTMAGSMKAVSAVSKGFLGVGTVLNASVAYRDFSNGDVFGGTSASIDGVMGIAGEFGGPFGLALSAGYLGMRASGADQVIGGWLTQGSWLYNTAPAPDPHPPHH